MSSSSVFIGTPRTWQAALAAANTNRDGSGTLVDVVAAGAAPGTRVDRVRVQASGSVSAGVIRLFVFDGTSTYLLREIIVPATVPSTALEAWSQEVTLNLVLANGWTLRASTHIAEAFKVFAFGGNFV